jgi:hypothetical protein
MHTPADEKAPIKMIDNGYSFDQDGAWPVPMYWILHHANHPNTPGRTWRNTSLHPKATEWLKSLDPQKLAQEIKDGGGDHEWAHRPQKRLAALKEYIEKVPNPTKGGAMTHALERHMEEPSGSPPGNSAREPDPGSGSN